MHLIASMSEQWFFFCSYILANKHNIAMIHHFWEFCELIFNSNWNHRISGFIPYAWKNLHKYLWTFTQNILDGVSNNQVIEGCSLIVMVDAIYMMIAKKMLRSLDGSIVRHWKVHIDKKSYIYHFMIIMIVLVVIIHFSFSFCYLLEGNIRKVASGNNLGRGGVLSYVK